MNTHSTRCGSLIIWKMLSEICCELELWYSEELSWDTLSDPDEALR